MTQIQIDWSKAQESKRHNQATELQAANELVETNRHNVAYESETKRHNVATERETNRHNVAYESETKRHNLKSERQEDSRIKETNRHNVAGEKESKRHNKATEKQKNVELAQQNKKITSEAALNDARTAAQQLANIADSSDPTLYKANRFSSIFKRDAAAAWIYYGLDSASKSEKEVVDAAAQGKTSADKAVQVIDALNYRKTGKHLSTTAKNDWYKIFTQGKKNVRSSRKVMPLE